MSCHWATNNVGTWFYGDTFNGVWHNCEMPYLWDKLYHDTAVTILVGGYLSLMFMAIFVINVWGWFDKRLGRNFQPSVPNYPYVEFAEEVHSSINVPAIIQQKMAPPPTSTVPPPVQQMTYTFGEPLHDDDHTVRLYLALSQEEAAIVKKRA